MELQINRPALKKLLKKRKLTNKTFAKRVGVDERTLRRWLWTDTCPREENVVTMAEVLNVPMTWLIMSYKDYKVRASTERTLDFYIAELLDKNEPADYREVQLIESDLAAITAGDDAADNSHSEIVVPETPDAPSDSVPDAAGGDGESGEGADS